MDLKILLNKHKYELSRIQFTKQNHWNMKDHKLNKPKLIHVFKIFKIDKM